jgi:Mrp family chromosome partitioning ATPase
VAWPTGTFPVVDLSVQRLRDIGVLMDSREVERQREDYRNIRREVLAATRATRGGTGKAVGPIVVVTSALPGDGKTYTALNLAISIASEDTRDVLLIDGDTMRASLTGICGLADKPGLIDLLRDPAAGIARNTLGTNYERLHVMPAGMRDQLTADLFSAERVESVFNAMFEALAGHVVIVDAPPILASSETQSLVDAAGQVLLVVRAGETLLDSVREAANRIGSDTPVGVVLNAWEPIYPSERKAHRLYEDYGDRKPNASGR